MEKGDSEPAFAAGKASKLFTLPGQLLYHAYNKQLTHYTINIAQIDLSEFFTVWAERDKKPEKTCQSSTS
jgi:hypothetical protein